MASLLAASGHFNIPEGTISIDKFSWDIWGVDIKMLITITIPGSVNTIGLYAFSECSSLASITIPDSVTTIGKYAFCECSSLASITIPDSVSTIAEGTFFQCSSLANITVPESVTSIREEVFSECSSLESVAIPDSVTTIGGWSFSGCSLLVSIVIPDSVTSIGDYTFYQCRSLASITIPDSVTTIGNRTFFGCSLLASITISNSVTNIGDKGFAECNLLTSVIIRPTTAMADEDGGNASTDVWRTVFELPQPPQKHFERQAPIPFENVKRISAPDAIINQLTGPFSDFTCLADVPRAMRVAPDSATWAAVELWLDWSPPTAAGYTDKTRTVCKARQRLLFATMLSAARAARLVNVCDAVCNVLPNVITHLRDKCD